MLMNVLRWLRDADIEVRSRETALDTPSSPRALVEVTVGEVSANFIVEQRKRAPYPNELPAMEAGRQDLGRRAQPLLVVPFVT